MSPTEMNLHRRFPDRITRRRRSPVDYDRFGDRVDAYEAETELRAAVQPLSLEDSDLVSRPASRRLKVYVRKLISGSRRRPTSTTVVEESRTWPKFTRATLLRET